jgi:hypothetical protein
VIISLSTLFQASTVEGWIIIMYSGIDATGRGTQPVEHANPAMAIFFVVFMTVMSFFMLNLFVGVAVDKFHEMKRQNGGHSVLLTGEQERWLELQRSLSKLRAIPRCLPPSSAWRARVFDVVTAERFDLLVIAVIVANAVMMATYHWGLPSAWDSAISWLNVAFTALYVAEAAAKILALGRAYFRVWEGGAETRLPWGGCAGSLGWRLPQGLGLAPAARGVRARGRLLGAVLRRHLRWACRWRQSSGWRGWGRQLGASNNATTTHSCPTPLAHALLPSSPPPGAGLLEPV